jgi:release factor glutamine methyltransferase
MPDAETASEPGSETVRTALIRATRRLSAAGVETPEVDARLLACAATGLGRLDVVAAPDRPLTSAERDRLEAFLVRRAAREPVSRILGCRGFFGRTFEITPATLDPRPDTETLVELTLDIVRAQGWRDRPLRLLDIGTGSGAILLTLLAELPQAGGLGTDIDKEALAVAARNAQRLGLSDRASFSCGRSLDFDVGEVDIVVSNPPYIPSTDIPGLEPEVRLYDPLRALDGGEDGLDVVRELAAGLDRLPRVPVLVLEVGCNQADKALKILNPDGGKVVRVANDLGGHRRCVAVWTQS